MRHLEAQGHQWKFVGVSGAPMSYGFDFNAIIMGCKNKYNKVGFVEECRWGGGSIVGSGDLEELCVSQGDLVCFSFSNSLAILSRLEDE